MNSIDTSKQDKTSGHHVNTTSEANFFIPQTANAEVQQPNNCAVLGNPNIVMNMNPAVGPKSTTLTCPQCRCRVNTSIKYKATTKTHIACLLLMWTVCCCCLPYCMSSCQNTNHFCPMCGTYIGTYES